MQKSKKLTFIVTLILVLAPTILSASATIIPTFTLSAQTSQIKYNLPAGTEFNGSISTTGTIRFWVNDPSGFQIVNLGLIDQEGTFSFVARQAGNYTLNFENDLPDAVQVMFSFETNPDISANSQTSIPAIYLAIPIAVAVVGSILIFLSLRRKKQNDQRLQ